MSTTVILESSSPEQLELLLKVAREMGISVSLLSEHDAENAAWSNLAMKQIEKEWNQAENSHWDEFIRKSQSK